MHFGDKTLAREVYHGSLLDILDRTSARSLSDDGSTTKEIQEHPQEENRNDEDDMADFDEGLVDMKHYKSNVSWVVLDDFTEDGSGGI